LNVHFVQVHKTVIIIIIIIIIITIK